MSIEQTDMIEIFLELKWHIKRILIKFIFQVDILEMPDKLGRTAMFYAVLYNQEEILEYFIEKQANCNVMLVDFFFYW